MRNTDLIKEKYNIKDLEDIVSRLRAKDGCPWDKEQTHESLKTCLIEECYEVIEAINLADDENLVEELGDVLLQIYLHSEIAREEERFTIEDVVQCISEKLIRRHPHVFGEERVITASEGLINWEGIKALEKKGKITEKLPLRTIPNSLPALIRAEKIIKKADKIYGKKNTEMDCIENLDIALKNVKKVLKDDTKVDLSVLIGEMLLNIVNLSTVLEENAENSLTNRLETFINIFEGNNC